MSGIEMQDQQPEDVHGAIILAAGASTRMGRVKQTLPWKESTLLQHAIDQVLASSIDEVVVVLGSNREHVEARTDLSGVHVVFNPKWEEGMATSIVSGLKALLDLRSGLRSVLILLSDQPLIDVKHYNKLIYSYISSGHKIISSSYSEQLGVPVVFDRRFFRELLELKGDRGARALLNTYPDDIIAIDAGDKGVDLDTEDKYRHYHDRFGQ